ncbi:probable phosphorylase b kinase regulatory subunit alpha isoform X1 [Belonocnema kinseyi]|uniref:probable phosphorylase b kinase regulatory subunit alpha isoform X1 n=1 Tax=Belonocnema kinseyi TaxID=2817044 RepID=UPI00143CCE05|nr:probable phosphorylase b kinase regulatory subunit alpha isoform X1 [Belonocnema kinseyi]XP_033216166.1 probable phosphorylase b kinase regulatory subunit alpha isoform X1 [Belonocnema kinseyi]XP_033216168.1 probable phosphorylase b kinase regulatory subunit alpha isoform X1 [Belonocnema kinseyi]
MRSRSNSGVRLGYYQRAVARIIMNHQNPVTGLFPASPDNDHAWIRDNVYTILAVWGLSMAYKKIADADEERAKTYELEQSCVKLMRGLLMAMMQQKDKVEKFKSTQNPLDALHAKYSSATGQSVVGDAEWGHLQIDAVSLYLLILAQMTASGLQIVFNLDEVAFIQNLVFYIEAAYCTPDYGMWERGDKTNHGLPELNASSIGMAKAAMEAMNDLDLFGARGGQTSVIHVLADEAQKCQAVLESMLPRESNSKELDSGLLSIISFPAFAVDEPHLIQLTRDAVTKKLQGRFGCKRFLRDGHRTPKEDPNRLYYEPWELRMFESIECEWPLFFCYLILDYCFQGNKELIEEYTNKLEKITIKTDDGMRLVPELYAVGADNVAAEYADPGSQEREALGRSPFMWGQSLYILGKLLREGFLAVGELDPLNRRLCSEKKPDVVVQVVILAEDAEIRDKIAQHDIHVQTIAEVAPTEVQPAKVLSHLYTYLGRNKKLGLSGRNSRDVGILSTSKLYSLHDKIFAFTPQLTDMTRFYIASDYELMIDIFKGEINFLKSSWQNMLGRPLVVMPLKNIHLDQGKIPLAMITTMKKLKSGYINGTRVSLGNLNEFLSTSCITNLSFLGSAEDGRPDKLNPQVQQYLDEHLMKGFPHRISLLNRTAVKSTKNLKRRVSVKGAIKKTRSIAVEPAASVSLTEPEILGMAGEDRRASTISTANPFIEVTDTSLSPAAKPAPISERTPSPTEDMFPWKYSPRPHRHRLNSETQYADTEVEELMSMLREAESLEEQGDILQYLVDTQGLGFDTGMLEDGHVVLLKDLLKGLYEKACQQKMWGIVRHAAGMLGKRVEDLAKAVTDLLVRQKQVTVGMPPANEQTIVAPLPENELRSLIHQAYGDDESTAMLTQELLVYLAMFIRTEPQLFHEMLRLRVGLIIQVMATELSRTLICNGEEASEHLLNLSPFEMKNLLHHIMSGKEFAISSVGRGNFSVISCKSGKVSKKSQIGGFLNSDEGEIEPDRQGQWLRRRRLDGALNRVPRDFYPRVWQVLERCQGLAIDGKLLQQNLTQEMTPGELKFALAVETFLNTIPQPEYRQLVVEALMVLTLVTEYNLAPSLGGIIAVEDLVHKANAIFLEDQMRIDGDATLCCAKPKDQREINSTGMLLCGGAAYVCQHFYDSAPSGSFGTMTYITRAIASLLDCFPKDHDIECSIS